MLNGSAGLTAAKFIIHGIDYLPDKSDEIVDTCLILHSTTGIHRRDGEIDGSVIVAFVDMGLDIVNFWFGVHVQMITPTVPDIRYSVTVIVRAIYRFAMMLLNVELGRITVSVLLLSGR